MHPLAILLISVALVFLLIIVLRVNAFVALVAAALAIGGMSGVPVDEIVGEVGTRLGGIVGRIGIPIVMAAIIGQCLMESGAADKITRRFVAAAGGGSTSAPLVASGFALSIPVFADTVFYLLIPLARSMTVRMGGKNFVLYALAISAGAAATHVLVPPTPGPLAMAAELGVDLGLLMMVGTIVAVPAALSAWGYSIWINKVMPLPLREAPGMSMEELEAIAHKPEDELPSLFLSLLPIALPVALIATRTIASTTAPEWEYLPLATFLGDPTISLMMAAIAGVWVLARQNGLTLTQAAKPVETAIASAGVIILITAGGGAYGGMLTLSGVGDWLGEAARSAGLSYIWLGFLLAVLFRVAQGSATSAMIAVSQIMAPLVTSAELPYNIVYVLTAIGSGSIVLGWMNDSGFWVYRTMTGFTEIEALKTKTIMLVFLGLGGMVGSLLMSWLWPLI